LVRNDVEGWLIAAGDGAALVARTAAMLADPALHARMRAAARARAETFGLREMVRGTQAVYERALAGRGRA